MPFTILRELRPQKRSLSLDLTPLWDDVSDLKELCTERFNEIQRLFTSHQEQIREVQKQNKKILENQATLMSALTGGRQKGLDITIGQSSF